MKKKNLPLMMILAAASWLALIGCVRTPDAGRMSATGFAQIQAEEPSGTARREALQIAEIRARDQLKIQLSRSVTSDGRPLQEVATVDPFVRAVLDDTVRAARITDQAINEAGKVAVTVQLELVTLRDLLGIDLTAPPESLDP